MASARACWGTAAASLFAAALAAQDGPRTAPLHVDGRVVDAGGDSLAKARVVLTGLAHPELPPIAAWALGAEARLQIEVVADARGVFHAELPHRGPFALLATSADGALGCRHFPVVAGDFVLTTARAPSVVDGVVVAGGAGGAPAAAMVTEDTSTRGGQLERYGVWFVPASTRADAAGRFALPLFEIDATSLPVFCKSLHAECGERASSATWYRLVGQSLHSVGLELDLQPVIDSRIVATDTGRPLAGAELLDLQDAAVVARADADGRVRFVNGGRHNLVVRAPGRAVRGFVAQGDACGLDPGVVVRLRLADEHGPAARRRVVVVTRDPQVVPQHIAWTTSTDGDGVLAIDEARAGETLYAFVETAAGFAACLRTVPDAKCDLGDVRIDPGRMLTGVVSGSDGRCAGMPVLLQPVLDQVPAPNGSLPPILTRVTYTDRAGRFRFDGVPHGRQRLLASAGADGIQIVAVGAKNDLGTIACGAGGCVEGQVRIGEKVIAGATVQCVLTPGGDGVGFGFLYLFAHADDHGCFAFHGLPDATSVTLWGMTTAGSAGWMGSDAFAGWRSGVALQLQPHQGRF